jgi:hypothetical protein
MQGTVTGIRKFGVVVQLDGTPEIGDLFELYRIQDGTEIILGKGYARKHMFESFKINPIEDESGDRASFEDVQMGDLVRSIEST